MKQELMDLVGKLKVLSERADWDMKNCYRVASGYKLTDRQAYDRGCVESYDHCAEMLEKLLEVKQ